MQHDMDASTARHGDAEQATGEAPVPTGPLTVIEAVRLTGRSERTIRRAVRDGRIGTVELDGRRLLQYADVVRLAYRQAQSATTPPPVQRDTATPDKRLTGAPEQSQVDLLRWQQAEIERLWRELAETRDLLSRALDRQLTAQAGVPAPQSAGIPRWALWTAGCALVAILTLLAALIWR